MTDDLDGAAREVWALMVAPVDPLPPYAACDMLNDRSDGSAEGREACGAALARAAAEWLALLLPNPPLPGVDSDRTDSDRLLRMLKGGAYVGADATLRVIRERLRRLARRGHFHTSDASAQRRRWSYWCVSAKEAIALVREVSKACEAPAPPK